MIKQIFKSTALAALLLTGGCVSNPERGILGFTQYMQQVVYGKVIWEYAIPGGGMTCTQNAWQNNEATKGKGVGYYRCESAPALESDLPFSLVATSTLGRNEGYIEQNPATQRFATSASCWLTVGAMSTRNQRLVSEKCGPKPTR